MRAVQTFQKCSRRRVSVLECVGPLCTQKPRGVSSGLCDTATSSNSEIAVARFLTVLLLGLSACVPGCGKKHEPPAAAGANLPPAVVRVQKIDSVKQPAVEEVVGTVQPKLQAVIEAKVSGRITRLPVRLGQSVK